MSPIEAGQTLIMENPDLLNRWLEGVTNVEGTGAVTIVRDDLGL